MLNHGIIVNMTSLLPFVFEFNPQEVATQKKINYVIAPNIGGSHKKRYFSGFDSKEVEFKLQCIDKDSAVGVKNQLAYFEQLRNPDPGLFGIAASFFGNENYPPPQILFQFGVSYIPTVWDVLNVDTNAHHFKDMRSDKSQQSVVGMIGIPIMADITIRLSLVEDHILNKANQIAEKASYIAGSVESLMKEVMNDGYRREHNPDFSKRTKRTYLPSSIGVG